MNLYCLCEGLLQVGSLAKGSWMFGWLGQPGNLHGMGARWTGMGCNSTKNVYPVHLVDRYD